MILIIKQLNGMTYMIINETWVSDSEWEIILISVFFLK